jgi:hypothetical protein
VHKSFTISGDASRQARLASESAAAIRAKNRFWRAAMRREAGGHENFFIAKNRDSESAQRAFGCHRRVATASSKLRSRNVRTSETPAAQALPATLTIAGAGFPRTISIVVRVHCRVADERTSHALIHGRQHFLKQDSVFFDVLVYSGCSAFRFPSARSD